jgi:hypothetical protein
MEKIDEIKQEQQNSSLEQELEQHIQEIEESLETKDPESHLNVESNEQQEQQEPIKQQKKSKKYKKLENMQNTLQKRVGEDFIKSLIKNASDSNNVVDENLQGDLTDMIKNKLENKLEETLKQYPEEERDELRRLFKEEFKNNYKNEFGETNENNDNEDNEEKEEPIDFNIRKLLSDEIFKILTKFVNEIDLSFEYIDKTEMSQFKKNISKIKKDTDSFDQFIHKFTESTKEHETSLYRIVSSDKKIKSQEFEFLNNIELLGLKFDSFKNENKNTKKSLIKYLYNIYMSCTIINNCKNLDDNNFDAFLQFMGELKENAENAQNKQSGSSSKPKRKTTNYAANRNANAKLKGIPGGIPGGLPGGLAGMSGMFNNLLGSEFTSNPEIMNIATEIAKDIENQNIDPMAILSSMMTGGSNPTVNNLISNITNKLESKISKGEIDENLLQEQAKHMMDTVQNNPLLETFLPKVNSNLKQNKKSKK